MNYSRYQASPILELEDRTWPMNTITNAPIWCSVDLRDGNQALMEPMNVEEKLEYFDLLVRLGFKEIEIGFPSCSQPEFDFTRRLIEENRIPEDVTIQVLIQCRDELIARTFEAVEGASKVIIHLYNSTSILQREVVFNKSKQEIIGLALEGVRSVKRYQKEFSGQIILEYSPESFTGTEPEYALEICNAVINEWNPAEAGDMIINLPETVEMNTPNVYADEIEWMSRRLQQREHVILSIHTHNDRGTGVAAAELALLAGAVRVEGTLFGNGERTGNVDLLTIAYNMFSQGIDPELKLSDINEIEDVYERCIHMPIPPRQPYAGKLVFTAFSGSHQDAINKGIKAMKEGNKPYWEVPYLIMDPADIGRRYEPIVRINSQSGKGGIAYIMENYHGFKLPKAMQKEFSKAVQPVAEREGEIAPDEILQIFQKEYLLRKAPLHFVRCSVSDRSDEDKSRTTEVKLDFVYNNMEQTRVCLGNGPIDAVKKGLQAELKREFRLLDYTEHALNSGSEAQAAAYVQMMDMSSGEITFGVGISSNITRASIRAVFCAVNRLLAKD